MRTNLITLAVVALVMSACVTTPETLQRALIEPDVVQRAIETEELLNAREGQPVPNEEAWFEVLNGTTPIIITAPHATRPLRGGERRFSDGGGTAALALAIGELTGANVIYTTYEGPSDPNYYDDNEFKSALAQLLVSVEPIVVLDIHGSHPYRSYDLDIGTMNGASLLGQRHLLRQLVQNLETEGITSLSGERFSAETAETITKYVSSHGVPAIQLEVNATWLTPMQGNLEAQRFSRLLQALVRYIRDVAVH